MLIKVDAAQLEWRVAVFLSGDSVGIEELNTPGMDIHESNREAFSLPTRLVSKTYLFRTIFRGNGWSFANDPRFTHVSNDPDFWDEVNKKFYKKYKGLDAWHQTLGQRCAEGKPIVSPFGREWLIPLTKHGDIPWTTCTNYPVQGTGADLVMLARISLSRRLAQMGVRTLMVSTVHDDIKLDGPDEEVPLVAKTAYEVFEDIPKNVKRLFNIDLPIKFPGEVSVGKDLLNMEFYANPAN